MLLFSTKLNVNSKLTADEFVRLVIEWNNTSKYPENIIPGLEWNGTRNLSVSHENLRMDIVELVRKSIIAARYEKRTEDGTIWTTGYILNLSAGQICIQLERSYMENALINDQSFSTPHFITMLINGGFLDTDNGIPVLRTPIRVGAESAEFMNRVLYGGEPYRLPIVYVSKTWTNKLPVSPTELAYRLKGVAHIIVADNAVSRRIGNGHRRAETGGDIGIYILNDIRRHKTYRLREYRGHIDMLLDRIVDRVIRYEGIKEIDPLYTWNGVHRELLNERIASLHEERKKAEEARHRDKLDQDELTAMYEEEITALQDQVDDLTNVNTSLELECHGLRSKITGKKSLPLLYFGREADLYPGEVKDLILRCLTEARKEVRDRSRRADVLDDIVAANEYAGESERLEKLAKTLLNGYKTMSGSTRQGIRELGFDISEDGTHYKLTYHGDKRYMSVLAKTGSDHREGKNAAQEIVKLVY